MRTQAYKGRNLIPFFHPLLRSFSLSFSRFFVRPFSFSPLPALALSFPDCVVIFLSLLYRPRDNDPELSKHHRRTLMEIESSRARHEAFAACARARTKRRRRGRPVPRLGFAGPFLFF